MSNKHNLLNGLNELETKVCSGACGDVHKEGLCDSIKQKKEAVKSSEPIKK